MSTKHSRNRFAHRRYRTNNNNRQQFDKRAVKQSPQEIVSNLIQQFNSWCISLRTKVTYEFDTDNETNHRCKMRLPIFPNLESIGNGAKTRKEAKANAIIAFLAHMEKRKQVGLFVPYVIPNLVRNIQVELRRANVSTPDLQININEYLLADQIISKHQAVKDEENMKTIERICDVRIIKLWQSANMTFVYIVGPKSKAELIGPFVKALFQPDNEQMFNYGEKLFDIFSDKKFLDNACLRLKVLCDNHLEQCKLFIRGSAVNVRCCYNEFHILRREFEAELHRNRKNSVPQKLIPSNENQIKTTTEQLESTRIDNDDKLPTEEKESDQLPDYSIYDDNVNASMLRVLRNEDDEEEEQTLNQETKPKPSNTIIELIEISDDSIDNTDLPVVQTVEPKIQNKPVQLQTAPQQPKPRPQPTAESQSKPQPRSLRHIVLDGQNIARNSNDYNRLFSWSRLSNAINYFKNRGHENIIAFLPLYYRDSSNKHLPQNDMNRERQIRDTLINLRYIAFTPSRYNNGQRLTNYDDRFILQYAADNDGIVVSNDNFRDLQHEKSFQFIISNRILPFATINDTFMPATDPLGRHGPNLDEFLSKEVCDQ